MNNSLFGRLQFQSSGTEMRSAKPDQSENSCKLETQHTNRQKGGAMKYYFLALGTLVLVCVGCASDGHSLKARNDYAAPPAHMMAQPGPMVGPSPAVMGMLAAPQQRHAFVSTHTQVRFLRPNGMNIGWQIGQGYAENQLVAPGRYDFHSGATYRLKMTNIQGPGREGLVLYPTLQIYPPHPTTDNYLAHNSVPIELTDEDLDQIASNNFVTKVIYLPKPKYQELAIAGVETLVSTRLDAGVDPVAEAERRGTIMAVLRVGNMDLEMNNVQPAGPGNVEQMSFNLDGAEQQFAEPVPISRMGGNGMGVPNPMIAATRGMPGMPAYHPSPGMGPAMMYGRPHTSTPIGLVGPPHLPYAGPATLKSHTIRNRTETHIPDGTKHLLIDVEHKPGIRMPEPVKYIKYSEKHPGYRPEELSVPRWHNGSIPPYYQQQPQY